MRPAHPGGMRRWWIFWVAAALYILSQFYRASIAVISPSLINDLALDTRGLSLTTSAFFYAFALTQIPIGVCLDRIGARKTVTALNLIGVAGAMVFALAGSLETLVIGRVLLGVGMACNLMGIFKLLTLWFDPIHFATLSALVISIGTAGNLTAATPLVLLVQQMGWRYTFTVFAAVNLILAFVFACVVRDRPDVPTGQTTAADRPETFQQTLSGLRRLFAMRDYWIISLATFCHYGIYAAIQALWAGPYLMQVMGFSAVAAGNIIFLLSIGMIAGGPFWGMLSDRWFKGRKTVVVIGIGGMGLCLGAMPLMPAGTAFWLPAIVFVSIGILRSAGGIMYAHIKDLMPVALAGTAMTGINFFTMIGPAIFVQVMGYLMDRLHPGAALGPDAFRAAFLFCSGCLFVVFILYLFTRESHTGR